MPSIIPLTLLLTTALSFQFTNAQVLGRPDVCIIRPSCIKPETALSYDCISELNAAIDPKRCDAPPIRTEFDRLQFNCLRNVSCAFNPTTNSCQWQADQLNVCRSITPAAVRCVVGCVNSQPNEMQCLGAEESATARCPTHRSPLTARQVQRQQCLLNVGCKYSVGQKKCVWDTHAEREDCLNDRYHQVCMPNDIPGGCQFRQTILRFDAGTRVQIAIHMLSRIAQTRNITLSGDQWNALTILIGEMNKAAQVQLIMTMYNMKVLN